VRGAYQWRTLAGKGVSDACTVETLAEANLLVHR
jgi:hypothetical protein